MERTTLRTRACRAVLTRLAVLTLFAIALLAVFGCSDALSEGLSLFAGEPDPADSLAELQQAALDRDETTFDAYFDLNSIAVHAYTSLIEQLRQTPEYQEMVAQLGEEQAEEILKTDVLAFDQVAEQVSATFGLSALPEGEGLLGSYEVVSSEIGEYEAELTVTASVGGQERTYLLGMMLENDPDLGMLWRIKEIKNITDFVEFPEP